MIKKCVICGREFQSYNRPYSGKHSCSTKSGSTMPKRPFGSLTCSKLCSRKHYYVSKHDYYMTLKDKRLKNEVPKKKDW